MHHNAAEFRQSIEASLPPLTQYSVQTGAPGAYGAYGWGHFLAAGHADGRGGGVGDSVRVSLDASVRASHDHAVDLSASLRNSFTRYHQNQQYHPTAESGSLRDSFQVSAREQRGPVMAASAPSASRFVTAQSEYHTSLPSLALPPEPVAAAQPAGKPPTAPVVPPLGVGGDACVVVQTVAPPTNMYPGIPAAGQVQAGGPQGGREDGSGRFGVPPAGGAAHAGVRFNESVTYQQYRQQQEAQQPQQQQQQHPQAFQQRPHQQPYQQAAPVYNGNGVVQGKVVHMRRTEAWIKYIAYEGCLQVCITELERSAGNPNAAHFLAGAFATLRRDLGIDGLLLTQVAGMPAAVAAAGGDGGINDICWDDMEPAEKRLNTVAFANTASTSYMRVRCARLSLPSVSVLQKLCCRTRTHMVLPRLSGVTVHLGANDNSADPAFFSLDSQGTGVQQGQALVLPLEVQQQAGQPPPPPPQSMLVHVENEDGVTVATGTLSYRELWRLAMQQKDPVDESRASSINAGVAVDVQVMGAGPYEGKVAFVTVVVTRVKKELGGYELAHVAPDGTGVETVNKNTLRTNACLAYDTSLAAALEATGCGRHKLEVEGPWDWLLREFAAYFGVRSYYCILAHLRWVLKPGVATISSMCLDVIARELKPLLEQSLLRGLTTHEATLLEGVKKAVEMLLEVAFENYYALGDDQPSREGGDTPRGATGAPAWRPTVLMASFRLFRVMKDVFLPSDQDWLNTRFRIAAKKRWHFLECNCGYDQMRGMGSAQQPPRPAGPTKLGYNVNQFDSYYKMAEKMGMAIRSDLEFDMFLQKQPDLLPSTLNLPRITAEEYMANFVEILRNMLHRGPPQVPSVAAVDLLVATAQLQRYLQETQLYMPRQHPGHLDAMELWKPHVMFWIENSRRGLNGHCGKLEAEAKLTAAHLARVDVAKMPGMIEGIEGAVAPLVHDMLDRTWSELMLYERVVKNWPLFGPHLEAALCDVLRTVQGSLNRICAGASNTAMTQQPGMPLGAGNSPHMARGHQRVPSGSPGMMGPPGSGGPQHGRNTSTLGYQPGPGGSPGPLGPMASMRSPGVPMVPQHGMGGMGGAGAAPGGRNVVLLKEAVLLNSLKVLMVMVPSIEDIISKWCGGQSCAPPGPPQPNAPDPDFDDDMAPHIGAQFAQVVKELRTDYAEGVASCSNRMANHIRATPVTNIKTALNQPKPPADQHGGYQQVSTLTHQRDFVEAFMRPILAACDEALQALRAALDPRVFVATGRALWDCMGKDLFEFVHFLQESHDNKGAWRLRQHANLALTHLCEFFRSRLAASMEHCIGERDLDLPINVDKAQKLLAQNTAVVNITLNPI